MEVLGNIAYKFKFTTSFFMMRITHNAIYQILCAYRAQVYVKNRNQVYLCNQYEECDHNFLKLYDIITDY